MRLSLDATMMDNLVVKLVYLVLAQNHFHDRWSRCPISILANGPNFLLLRDDKSLKMKQERLRTNQYETQVEG
mgnify:CR=1 FL=1